jgi:hypothetical protein
MESKSITFMKNWLLKKGINVVGTTEEFNGVRGGLWIDAEDYSGQRFFNYYNYSESHIFGVKKKLSEQANRYGWYFSWNDPGTMMLWEI